ncbi:hypothetical protein KKHLCK_16985 [Candidatus Electrothrix laxa]
MRLKDIGSQLKQKLDGGKLVLNKTTTDSPEIIRLVETLPGQQLVIKNAAINLLEQAPATLSVAGESFETLRILGIAGPGIALGHIQLTVIDQGGDSPPAVTLEINSTLNVADKKLSMIAKPTDNGTWLVNPVLKDIPPLSLSDLVNLGGGSRMVAYLPPGIDAFQSVVLEEFGLQFDPQQKEESSLSFSVTSPLHWEIISDLLAIAEITVSVQITHEPSTANRTISSFSCQVGGTVQIGDTDFQIILHISGAGYWAVEILPEADKGLPTLSVLAEFSGGKELCNSVSQSLKTLGLSEPSITKVKIGFTLPAQRLSYVSIGGRVRIHGIDIDVLVSLPDFSFAGSLAPNSKIDIKTLLQDFGLEAEPFPDLAITTLVLNANPKSKSYAVDVQVTSDWSFELGNTAVALTNLELNIFHTGGARSSTTGTISGIINLAGTDIILSADNSASGQDWTFKGIIPRLNLSTLIEQFLDTDTLPPDLPDLVFSNVAVSVTPKTCAFSLSGNATTPWEIPVGIDGLNINNVNLSVKRTVQANRQKKISGTIGGTLKIGSASFAVAYNFPGDFVLTGNIPSSFSLSPLMQELCDGNAIRSLPVPASVLAVKLSGITVSIAPQRKSCSFAASSPFGQTEIVVKQIAGRGWGFIVGFKPPAGWKFSDIDGGLNVLDSLHFSNVALILASSDDPSFALTSVRIPSTTPSSGVATPTPGVTTPGATTVKQGINFFADLDLSGLGVDELTGHTSLSVYAAIGTRPSDLVLEAGIKGRIQIAENVAMGDVKFRLKPAPSDFSLTLLGKVEAQLDQSTLQFIGGLQVQVTPPTMSATLQATMKGSWNEPFSTKGVVIADVALDLGISYPPLAPVIGIAGALQVGDFKGAAAVKFDSTMPSKSMIAVAFNRLYLMDIVHAFCKPQVAWAIPQALTTTVLDLGFEEVKVYIVPQPTQIGELRFPQGFTVQGIVQFAGLRAYAYANIDYVKGILVEGEVDVINLVGLFKLTGADGDPKASLELDLRLGQKNQVEITGAVTLLGLTREAKISISDKGFSFMISGKIFDLFACTFEANGGTLANGDAFLIKASMQNDLFAYLKTETSKTIKAGADKATRKISDAQKAIRNAQAKVNRLNKDIKAMRQTIQRERDKNSKGLRDAQKAVQNVKTELKKINNDIEVMRLTIQKERDKSNKGLKNAQKAVAGAQKKVDSIQGEINKAKKTIASHKRKIREKEQWHNQFNEFEKIFRLVELNAERTKRGIMITRLFAQIGTLEAGKTIAIGILEVAKQTLRGLEQAAKTFPIDADPRVGGLFTARETAKAGLEVAKQTLRGLEQAAKTFPIDADPRMIGLFTARETANASLEAASLFLEGVKTSVGAVANVGDYIIKHGLDSLLNIRSASFEASLNTATIGRIKLQTELVFMDKTQKVAFQFNFNNPLASVQDLAQLLLPV